MLQEYSLSFSSRKESEFLFRGNTSSLTHQKEIWFGRVKTESKISLCLLPGEQIGHGSEWVWLARAHLQQMQPGAQGTCEDKTFEEEKRLHKAAGNVKVGSDLLDLVSTDLQRFPCIASELAFVSI